MQDIQHITIGADADGQRLDRWLKKQLPRTPYALLQKMMRTGQIRIDGKRAKADQRLQHGQVVRIPPAEEKDMSQTFVPKPGDKDLVRRMVIYDDGDVIVFNKPYGLAVQGGPSIPRHLDGMLPQLANEKGTPRLVHRLDRDTSGVLVCVRSLTAARRMGDLFAAHTLEKIYWAVVSPPPKQDHGVLDAALIKGTIPPRKESMIIDPVNGKPARTQYKVLERTADNTAAAVAFWPRTGRTHQIRVHTADVMGCPIIGDEKYGPHHPEFDAMGIHPRLHLHAARLTIPHPITNIPMMFEAPLPSDLAGTCKIFGFNPVIPADIFAEPVKRR
ncbi:MAG: RluA family pseudouridine synthase [Pseudomonadota bacterium]